MESERRSKGNKEADVPSLLLLYPPPPTQTEQPASLLWWGLGSHGTERTLFPTKESSRWMLWRPALSRSLADVSGDVERMSSTTSRSIGDSGHFRPFQGVGQSSSYGSLFSVSSYLLDSTLARKSSASSERSQLVSSPPFFLTWMIAKPRGGRTTMPHEPRGFGANGIHPRG